MSFETAFFEFAAGRPSQLPESDLPEVVFSGKSNVGKSSMINKVLNRKSLARVSATPGKTGTINFYNLGFCRWVDLPGYGYAKVSRSEKLRWAELVEGYFQQKRDIRALIQLIDLRRTPSLDDLQMIDLTVSRGIPCIVSATKCDKLNKTQRAAQDALFHKTLDSYQTIRFLPFSAVTGEGVEQFKACITDLCSRERK